jgi:hypothetical protein
MSIDSGRDARKIRRPIIGEERRNTVLKKLLVEEEITPLHYLRNVRTQIN